MKSIGSILLVIGGFSLLPSQVFSKITVISRDKNATVDEINDQPARYVAQQITLYGIEGFIVNSNPPNACSPVDVPPVRRPEYYPFPDFPAWILLARRFDCDFDTKILNAQHAGYSAIIIHNVGSNSTEAMGTVSSSLIIISTFVGEYDGLLLKNNYSDPSKFFVRVQDDFTMSDWLLPFAIGVGICFSIMLIIMIAQQVMRWLRERRRSRRRKLPNSVLRRLPTKKFTKSDPYETCVVCLEDFIENDKLRILPCSHAFHMKCIDPWLTKNRRVCPICKRKVILAGETFSGSDTSDDETTPLLGPQAPSSSQASVTSETNAQVRRERSSIAHRIQRRFMERRGEAWQTAASNANSNDENSDLLSTDGSEVSSTASEGHESSGETRNVRAEVHNTTSTISSFTQFSNRIENVLRRFGIHQPPTRLSDVDEGLDENEGGELGEEHTFQHPPQPPSPTSSTGSGISGNFNSSEPESDQPALYIVDNESRNARNSDRDPSPPQSRNAIV